MNTFEAPLAISLDRIRPLPGVVLDLLRSLDDEQANFASLAKRIGQDPVLSARVLRVVNSPFYGMAGGIDNLAEAVMVLGFSAIRSMTLAASLAARFGMKPIDGVEPLRIWEHSFTCALVAQRLAPIAGLSPDTTFTAGLLHDIGIIAIVSLAPERYAELLQVGADRAEVERRLFGAGHDEIGARLLGAWRLPKSIVEAVRWHHTPGRTDSRLVDLIHIADLTAHERVDIGLSRDKGEHTQAALGRLGLEWGACTEAIGSVDEQVEALVRLLKEAP